VGHSPAGLFGFSHMLGGYSGGQAEYLRVPMADVGPIKVPNSVSDHQALFLSDIFPTGYMAAEKRANPGRRTVAIWGCGPVGQFAIRSVLMMGAGRVIAIDEVPERLAMAEAGGAETIDFSK
jgi:threonine dehydrogenase-like Zn-dependent dehydrogenase